MDAARRQPVSPPLFYGFAVASIGGPLALAVIYVPGAADMRSAGLVTLVGAFLYAAPLSVWLRFSRDVVSPAGLAGFVEAAAGPPARGREPHDPPRSARRRADRRRVPGGFTAPFAFTGVPVRRVLRGIAVPFIALGALTLINPEWFDEHVLRPSLIALYLSQLIVFAVYPLYRRRPLDVALAALAPTAWGLWRGITAPVAT